METADNELLLGAKLAPQWGEGLSNCPMEDYAMNIWWWIAAAAVAVLLFVPDIWNSLAGWTGVTA